MLTKAEAAGMMRAVADFVQAAIGDALRPFADRLAAVESRQPDRGEKGERGEIGERGEKGVDGERGIQGERGLDGLHGEKGERGDIGPQGERGIQGEPGESGLDGLPGEKGERGDVGPQGERGERGPEGPPGKLPQVRAWSDGVWYEGDVVSAGGSTWQALRDTGKAPGHADWVCLAARGADGADGTDGRGFSVRGTWAEAESYAALDIVMLNGASFVARHDDPGPCPGDGWQLWAAQGKTGKPGERGPKGDKGDRGDAGLPVVAMSVDGEGLLTLTNGDGSQVTCDLYPVLAKIRG